jgi:hypothetical protein
VQAVLVRHAGAASRGAVGGKWKGAWACGQRREVGAQFSESSRRRRQADAGVRPDVRMLAVKIKLICIKFLYILLWFLHY